MTFDYREKIRQIRDAAGIGFSRVSSGIVPLKRLLFLSLADAKLSAEYFLSVDLTPEGFSLALAKLQYCKTTVLAFEARMYATGENQSSVVAHAAQELLRKAGVASVSCVVSVPSSWYLGRTVTFPITVQENLSDVVRYEFDRLFPFHPDETWYDYRCIASDKETITLLLYAMPNAQISSFAEALGNAGISVREIFPDVLTLGALCCHLSKQQEVAVIDASGRDQVFAWYGSGAISDWERQSLPDAEALNAAQGFIARNAAGKSATMFARFGESDQFKRSLYGTGLQVNSIRRVVSDAGYADSSTGLPCCAVGGVMCEAESSADRMDLLSQGRRQSQSLPKALTVLLIVLMLGVFGVSTYLPIERDQRQLAEIEQQIAAKKREAKAAEAVLAEIGVLKAEMETINDFREDQPLKIVLWKELTDSLPKTTWLTRLRITQTGVECEGYAKSAAELLPILEKTAYFHKAEFVTPTLRDPKTNQERFVIKMELKEPVDVPDQEGADATH